MLAWEKIVAWVLALVFIGIIAYFIVTQIGGEGGAFGNLFKAVNDTGSAFPTDALG